MNLPSRFVHEKLENFGSDKPRRLRGCYDPHSGAIPRNLSISRSNWVSCYHSLTKHAYQNIITPVFKTKSSGTCFVFVSDYGFSTLPTKATVRESPPSFKKAPTTESMIVILSVMCIVPK